MKADVYKQFSGIENLRVCAKTESSVEFGGTSSVLGQGHDDAPGEKPRKERCGNMCKPVGCPPCKHLCLLFPTQRKQWIVTD